MREPTCLYAAPGNRFVLSRFRFLWFNVHPHAVKHGFDVSHAARSESLPFIHGVRKCSLSACYGRAELPDEMYPDEVCR